MKLTEGIKEYLNKEVRINDNEDRKVGRSIGGSAYRR